MVAARPRVSFIPQGWPRPLTLLGREGGSARTAGSLIWELPSRRAGGATTAMRRPAVSASRGLDAPAPAVGFGTIDSGGQHREHGRITRAALACANGESARFEPATMDYLAGHAHGAFLSAPRADPRADMRYRTMSGNPRPSGLYQHGALRRVHRRKDRGPIKRPRICRRLLLQLIDDRGPSPRFPHRADATTETNTAARPPPRCRRALRRFASVTGESAGQPICGRQLGVCSQGVAAQGLRLHQEESC
jgi:hypothetical protein